MGRGGEHRLGVGFDDSRLGAGVEPLLCPDTVFSSRFLVVFAQVGLIL